MQELIIDSFAGGGGASKGIEAALGRSPDIAINHDLDAIRMHAANHPATEHHVESIWDVNIDKLVGGRSVGLLWASPDCKHFSRAKGAKPVDRGIRSLAWIVVKWAGRVRPRVIMLENVREFAEWGPLVPRWVCSRCDWKGTEGQATLARSRRRCPECDSVRLQATDDLVPDPAKKGMTFRLFLNRLRGLGYKVEYRNMDSADYGAKTHRRRLFLIARCDGQPIVWPKPTHAAPEKIAAGSLGMQPYRTAAECIDWSIPCPSIFERSRPLAEKTMRRIAMGIKRYVLENASPFLVPLTHSGDRRVPSVDEPLSTITTAKRGEIALVSPYMVPMTHENRPTGVDEPMQTVTTQGNRFCLVSPTLVELAYGDEGSAHRRPKSLHEPVSTIHSGGKNHALAAATLVQVGYGERDGQSPRALDIEKPLGTVVAGGSKHALVTAFMAKHFGGMVGVPIDTPMPTQTTRGTQNQIVTANLVHFNHGDKQWSGVDTPLRTITSAGRHAALVYSFLVKYFGTAIGQSLDTPMHTATSKGRFGVVTVTVDGQLYIIVDIGMRMLTPRELALAQGFPADYVLTGTKTSQVARIGNSVPPIMPEVLLRANYHRGMPLEFAA